MLNTDKIGKTVHKREHKGPYLGLQQICRHNKKQMHNILDHYARHIGWMF